MPQVASNQAAWTMAVTGENDARADARVQAIIAANQSAPLAAPTAHAEMMPAGHLAANLPLPGATRRLH
jgi:hypothetical protein